MIRLGFSVEGPTERAFISRVLGPHLARFNVDAHATSLGGNVSLDRIRDELPPLLGSFDHVSTLYDFYGFKKRGARNVDELLAAISDLVHPEQRRHLTPYVQMYEFEALLFAVPETVVHVLDGGARELAGLRSVLATCGPPEAVNDSPQTSPSHRLASLFPHFDKPLHGRHILEAAGLAAIRAECPRFDAWVASLEMLGDL